MKQKQIMVCILMTFMSIVIVNDCFSDEISTDTLNNQSVSAVLSYNYEELPNDEQNENNPIIEDIDVFTKKASVMSEDEKEKYHSLLRILCSQQLWTDENNYDACHGMLIPMHYAFKSSDDIAIDYFNELFFGFVQYCINNKDNKYCDISVYGLRESHFIYLASQYLCLYSSKYNDITDWQKVLLGIISDGAINYTFNCPAIWHIEDSPCKHLQEIIKGKAYSQHYYSAFTDAEMFNISILCDCKTISRNCNIECSEYSDIASKLFYDLVTSHDINRFTDDGGWILQPGVWSDYPDFLYAGNTYLSENLEIKIVDDIAWDTSHSLRIPAFLNSLISSLDSRIERENVIDIKSMLANQMINHVLYKDGRFWFTTVFMDGYSGVYRYDPDNAFGYVGNDLSNSIFTGWWALLYDNRISNVYSEIYEYFPLKNNALNPYYVKRVSKTANPYLVGNEAYEKGWMDFMVLCASLL